MNPLTLLVVAALILVLGAGWLGLYLGRSRGSRAAGGVVLLRLGALAILALLAWRVFWSFEETEEAAAPVTRRLLVLEDRSLSMDFLAAAGRSRQALAETVWRHARQQAESRRGVQAVRHFFGANVVPADELERLDRGGTALGAAVSQTLARTRLDALLVVSDGASTDGSVPPYLLQWARNRDLPVFAVACTLGEYGAFDLLVSDLDCPRQDPEDIAATLVTVGQTDEPMTVQLEVDGAVVQQEQLEPAELQQYRANLPRNLPPGWHELALRILPRDGEVTAGNNLARDVFQVLPARGLLYVYDLPRIENLHVARMLKDLYPDRVDVRSVRDPALARLDPTELHFLVLGDVNPERLPAKLRNGLAESRTTVMVLAGDHLPDWAGLPLLDLPGLRLRRERNLGDEREPVGRVVLAERNRHRAFEYLELERLQLDRFFEAQSDRQTAEVLSLDTRTGRYPLLVADAFEQPRRLMLLTDTTWKLAIHPEAGTRAQYRALWSTLFSWVVGDSLDQHDLKLEFVPSPLGESHTRARVTALGQLRLANLDRPKLQLQLGEPQWREDMQLDDEALVYDYPHPEQRPVVVWFQAVGRLGRDEIRSSRLPLLLQPDSAELLVTAAQPETLRRLVAPHEDRFAAYPEHEVLLARLLDQVEVARPPALRRQRQPHLELTLAALIALLLGGEWLLERNLKDRPPTS